MRKQKLLTSIVLVLMITLVVGNVCSLATEGSAIKITANTNTTNNTTNDVVSNKSETSTVNGATNNAVNNTANKTTNNTTNNTTKNNTVNNTNLNTVRESSLPKAGTDTTVVFLILAFVASAIYAYRKVSDYNI